MRFKRPIGSELPSTPHPSVPYTYKTRHDTYISLQHLPAIRLIEPVMVRLIQCSPHPRLPPSLMSQDPADEYLRGEASGYSESSPEP